MSNQAEFNELNSSKMNVHFGIGGIRYGPEFEDSGREQHIRVLNQLSSHFFREWDHLNPIARLGIRLRTAGKFEPDLVTHVGKIKYSKRYISLEVPMFLALESFQKKSENDFRELFVGMLDNAFNQTVVIINKKDLPYPAQSIEIAWAAMRAEYLALPLPIVFVRDNKPHVPPSGVEYFFVFDKKLDRTLFLKKVAHFGLEVETDSDEGRHWCTLSDSNARKVDKEMEQQLVHQSEACTGEYDGWSAPEL
ncbi:MAG: ribonuclease E inhibitor RraB [Fimbriimonadaceae bacterium]|nr:MAG: ribonuclease E inhibitor RraB [Fimbriimonadaceae bacterium]